MPHNLLQTADQQGRRDKAPKNILSQTLFKLSKVTQLFTINTQNLLQLNYLERAWISPTFNTSQLQLKLLKYFLKSLICCKLIQLLIIFKALCSSYTGVSAFHNTNNLQSYPQEFFVFFMWSFLSSWKQMSSINIAKHQTIKQRVCIVSSAQIWRHKREFMQKNWTPSSYYS